MKISKKKFAFSLIELSVVIIIIGILVIGITKGSRIILESKLKTARSLTNSAPVTAIGDVVIWLESTMVEKSFDAGISYGSTIQNWNNIDLNDTTGKKASQNTAANRPTYLQSGINGLPALKFSSISDSFAAGSDCMSITNSYENNIENITIFVVSAPSNPQGNYQFIMEKWNDSGDPYPYVVRMVGGYSFAAYDTSNNPNTNTTSSLAASVFSARRTKGGVLQMWVNGVQKGSNVNDNTGNTKNNADIYLGCRHFVNVFMDGYVGEIIIFGRPLKDSERISVENYLKQKWGIK